MKHLKIKKAIKSRSLSFAAVTSGKELEPTFETSSKYIDNSFAASWTMVASEHRDCSSHIERACELHGVKMTRHDLLHKGLTSAD